MRATSFIKKISAVSVIAMALLVSQPVLANEVEVKVPPGAKLAWVSSDLNQDGMRLSIRTFESPESIESVFQFYREVWFREGEIPGFLENEMGEWMLISQLRDEHNIVVQLKSSEQGGSEGFLSIAQKTSGAAPPDLDFPMPDGTEKFSATYVEENGSQVHTMTFLSNQSISSAASFYKSSLKQKGWELARENEHEGSEFMMFNRHGDRLELVVSQLTGESTVIFANRIKRNG